MLEPRQNASVASPLPISVGPSQYWDGNDGPWSSFAMQIGHPAQDVRLLISTASFDTWVIDASLGCPDGIPVADCAKSRGFLFNQNQSSTWVPNSIFQLALELNLDLDSTGDFGFDTVALGWQGSGVPREEHQVVATIADPKYWLGVFGLDPNPTNFSNFNSPQTSYLQSLKNHGAIPSISWAYTAGAPYRFNKVFGSLTIGGYDASLSATSNVSIPFYSDITRDLTVGIHSITSNTSQTPLLSAGIYAFIDSTVPYFFLPLDSCRAFETAFGLVWNDAAQLYLVNSTVHSTLLALNPSVTFTIGANSAGGPSVDIELPYGAFDLTASYPLVQNSTSYFPLKRAAISTQYTLGRAFLQEAYVIADYERQIFTVSQRVWNQNQPAHVVAIPSLSSTTSAPTPPSSLPSPSPSSSPSRPLLPTPSTSSLSSPSASALSTGAIIGIVVGVISLLLLASFAVIIFLRRHRRSRRQSEGIDPSSHNPDIMLKPKRLLMVESDSQERFELHARQKPAELGGRQESFTKKPEMDANIVPIRYELQGDDKLVLPPGTKRGGIVNNITRQ